MDGRCLGRLYHDVTEILGGRLGGEDGFEGSCPGFLEGFQGGGFIADGEGGLGGDLADEGGRQ